jgi:hypothetical protein
VNSTKDEFNEIWTAGKIAKMKDIFLRFVIGGFIVSCFAVLGDIFKPKSFAGLFGAAPSIALATVTLTIATKGREYAAIEARSMIAGALAFFVYASWISWIAMRYRPKTLLVTTLSIPVWFGTAFGIWHAFLK